MDEPTKPPKKTVRTPQKPKKTPKLKADGTPDLRSLNRGIPKGDKPKTAHIHFQVTEDAKTWLKERAEGMTAWLEAKIKEEMDKGR